MLTDKQLTEVIVQIAQDLTEIVLLLLIQVEEMSPLVLISWAVEAKERTARMATVTVTATVCTKAYPLQHHYEVLMCNRHTYLS